MYAQCIKGNRERWKRHFEERANPLENPNKNVLDFMRFSSVISTFFSVYPCKKEEFSD